jgi:hypothetical protein
VATEVLHDSQSPMMLLAGSFLFNTAFRCLGEAGKRSSLRTRHVSGLLRDCLSCAFSADGWFGSVRFVGHGALLQPVQRMASRCTASQDRRPRAPGMRREGMLEAAREEHRAAALAVVFAGPDRPFPPRCRLKSAKRTSRPGIAPRLVASAECRSRERPSCRVHRGRSNRQ